jgi:basic membrane protein A
MRKRTFKGLAIGLVAVVGLAACGGSDDAASDDAASEDTEAVAEETTAEPTGLACQVTDVGGVDDKGFNQAAYDGLLQAEAELGVTAEYLESQGDADYDPNLQSFIDKGCDVIITVGFLLADATKKYAEANPDVAFAIVDSGTSAANVQGLTFAANEGAFLTGYLSAAMSETGVVGTYGGINIPPVTVWMQGFALGVKYYNEQKGADVKVLGWDVDKQDGTFAGNFESLDDGRNIAKTMYDEGADIIFTVAGPVGLGSAAFAQETDGKLRIIGVDKDMAISDSENANVYLASALKGVTAAVFQAVQDGLAGTGGGTDYIGTLANGGAGYVVSQDIPAELQAELDEIQQGIIDGAIATL